MNKATIDFEQFSLAPRRNPAAQAPNAPLLDASGETHSAKEDVGERETVEHRTVLTRPSDEERRRRGAKRAAEQDDARRRLKSLKRAKDRAIRYFVNVPLEQEMKARLVRAAHENDVKMTVIMQAAIETYLEDNGY